jgi:hypothetical protein
VRHVIVTIVIVIAGIFLIKKIKKDEKQKCEALAAEIENLKLKYSEVKIALGHMKQKHELELLKIEISTEKKYLKETKDELLKLRQTSKPMVIKNEKEPIPFHL